MSSSANKKKDSTNESNSSSNSDTKPKQKPQAPKKKSFSLNPFRLLSKTPSANVSQDTTVSIEQEEAQVKTPVECKKSPSKSPSGGSAAKKREKVDETEKTQFERLPANIKSNPAVSGNKARLISNDKLKNMMKKSKLDGDDAEDKTEFERVRVAKRPAISKGLKAGGLRWKSSSDTTEKTEEATTEIERASADKAMKTMREEKSVHNKPTESAAKKRSTVEDEAKSQVEKATTPKEENKPRGEEKTAREKESTSKQEKRVRQKSQAEERNEKTARENTTTDDGLKKSISAGRSSDPTNPTSSPRVDTSDINPSLTAVSKDAVMIPVVETKVVPVNKKRETDSISLVPVYAEKGPSGGSKSSYILELPNKDVRKEDAEQATEREFDLLPPFYQK